MEEKDRVLLKQGAEAKIYLCSFLGRKAILKERCRKGYRLKSLDDTLTKERTKAELRSLLRCKQIGVYCPAVYFVDSEKACITMEYIPSITVVQVIQEAQSSGDQNDSLLKLIKVIGSSIAKMHCNNIIHGDLTTSNMLLYTNAEEDKTTTENKNMVYFIDFGLSYVEESAEHKGVDLYVLERAFISTHPNSEDLFQHLLDSYKNSYKSSKEVMQKLDEVRMRGRKRTMVG